jgi:hypothetical protein
MADATITIKLSDVPSIFDPVQVEAHMKRVVTSLPNEELGRKNAGYDVKVEVK